MAKSAQKLIVSIEINKVGFREQRLLGRHDNVKEIPQKKFKFHT